MTGSTTLRKRKALNIRGEYYFLKRKFYKYQETIIFIAKFYKSKKVIKFLTTFHKSEWQ